ncbi:unnamed protein product [Haemonchus placei]|uniref:Uncharacterized protein n=1 Tax=Haemonchus placei TaxID=6290 RepID=A0A0N4WST9_HAEPC|nr:unnamed protein product [Haemonchus placei]
MMSAGLGRAFLEGQGQNRYLIRMTPVLLGQFARVADERWKVRLGETEHESMISLKLSRLLLNDDRTRIKENEHVGTGGELKNYYRTGIARVVECPKLEGCDGEATRRTRTNPPTK